MSKKTPQVPSTSVLEIIDAANVVAKKHGMAQVTPEEALAKEKEIRKSLKKDLVRPRLPTDISRPTSIIERNTSRDIDPSKSLKGWDGVGGQESVVLYKDIMFVSCQRYVEDIHVIPMVVLVTAYRVSHHGYDVVTRITEEQFLELQLNKELGLQDRDVSYSFVDLSKPRKDSYVWRRNELIDTYPTAEMIAKFDAEQEVIAIKLAGKYYDKSKSKEAEIGEAI